MASWTEEYQTARAAQADYLQDYMQRLTNLVTEYLDAEGNFLVPRQEDLEQHEMTMATYLHGAYLELGINTHQVRMARFARDKMDGVTRIAVRNHYDQRNIKLPTAPFIDAEVAQDPRLEEAERELAAAEQRLIASQGVVKALELKASLLPGMQGLRNRCME